MPVMFGPAARAAAAALVVVAPSLAPLPAQGRETPARIAYADRVEGDEAAVAFLRALAGRAAAAAAPAELDAAFDRPVRVFSKGLDPQEPWTETDPITDDPASEAADALFGEGERLQADAGRTFAALKALLAEAPGAPLGRLPEAPGLTCAPARLDYDMAALTRFALTPELTAEDLRIVSGAAILRASPDDGPIGVPLLPMTVLFPAPQLTDRDGWIAAALSDGRAGYVEEGAAESLRRMHLCFGPTPAGYRIKALFRYGL